MRIVLDARVIRSGMTGVGRYAAELAARFGGVRPDDHFIFLTLRGQDPALRPSTAGRRNVEWLEVGADPESHPAGDWWEQRALPRLLRELGADVFHGPAYQVPFLVKGLQARRVVTLHDLSVFSFPSAYPAAFRFYLRWVISRSVTAADRVICDSDFVRREAVRLFPRLDPAKFAVIPLAAGAGFRPPLEGESEALRRQYGFPPSFLLMVGTVETRKNPGFFPELYKILEARLGPAPLPALIWAGTPGRDWRHWTGQTKRVGIGAEFRFPGAVSAEVLRSLYQCAEMLVYPSLHEGFGLPVVEAMACGIPVVGTHSGGVEETIEDEKTGLLVERGNATQLADAMVSLLGDASRRESMGRAGRARAAELFSWDRVARELANLYESLDQAN